MNSNNKIRLPNTRKEKEVWDACDQINADKQPITYYAIGEKLMAMGCKRGSNSDIRRYLKTWRKSQLSVPAIPTQETTYDVPQQTPMALEPALEQTIAQIAMPLPAPHSNP